MLSAEARRIDFGHLYIQSGMRQEQSNAISSSSTSNAAATRGSGSGSSGSSSGSAAADADASAASAAGGDGDSRLPARTAIADPILATSSRTLKIHSRSTCPIRIRIDHQGLVGTPFTANFRAAGVAVGAAVSEDTVPPHSSIELTINFNPCGLGHFAGKLQLFDAELTVPFAVVELCGRADAACLAFNTAIPMTLLPSPPGSASVRTVRLIAHGLPVPPRLGPCECVVLEESLGDKAGGRMCNAENLSGFSAYVREAGEGKGSGDGMFEL
eukprot:UC1_evm1s646